MLYVIITKVLILGQRYGNRIKIFLNLQTQNDGLLAQLV
jgi:hypothetical protein